MCSSLDALSDWDGGYWMPERTAHRLLGSVCICGKWSAQCGEDVPGQYAAHLAATQALPPGQETP